MGFDTRFTLVALAWVAVLLGAIVGGVAALAHGGGAATLTVAAAAAVAGFVGLIRHVEGTNLAIARFVEGLRLGDAAVRMPGRSGRSFATLAAALNDSARALHAERRRDAADLRFLEALLDDVPIALLLVEGTAVRPANKAARTLFGRDAEGDVARFAGFGAAFLDVLTDADGRADRILPLTLADGTRRALVRRANMARLGTTIGVVMVEPIQQALDAAEVAAQAAMVRVLTHEILNSLTPIVSLAGTAAVLLGEDPVDLDDARAAVLTLARRAESTRRFIDSYREMARPLEPRRRRFPAQDFAQEMARVFAIEWIDHRLDVAVEPGLTLDADPDLLAQATINLLRNAAQASDSPGRRHVRLRFDRRADGAALAVEDDGDGIPASVADDVFLPFFTTKPGGSGIGLHLVRQIAVAHGGRVDLAPAAPHGTIVRLSGI